jgi:hypothetical protein
VYFQSIDDKKECVGLYYDSKCVFENLDFSKLTRTWRPTETSLQHEHIDYAWLWCLGKSLSDVCPSFLEDQWTSVDNKMKAFSRSLSTAKVEISENCLLELLPPKEISRFLDVKNRITEHVFSRFEKPEEYDHLFNVVHMLEDIKHRNVNLDMSSIKSGSYKNKNRVFLKNLKDVRKSVSYNLFGTKTGRLTVEKGFFPVLTLDRELRKHVRPNNDLFVEIDVNGAEARTLLSLTGHEQPEVDIHEWNAENVYRGLTTRDEAKKRFFAWLYNPASDDYLSSRSYSRDLIKEKFFDGRQVRTPFNRKILSDEYHCVNYTLQSTSNDICLEQSKKVFDFLKEKKSNIAFLMHDSVILDFAAEDKHHIREIINIFQETRFGKYRTNVKMGKSFGDMREISWKL